MDGSGSHVRPPWTLDLYDAAGLSVAEAVPFIFRVVRNTMADGKVRM
jgi:hypothetical protein